MFQVRGEWKSKRETFKIIPKSKPIKKFLNRCYRSYTMTTKRSDVVQFIFDEYFEGSLKGMANATGFTVAQISNWLSGRHNPHKSTIEYILQRVFVPEFKVIAEFAPYDFRKPLQTQLKQILRSHADECGIYAFYDSMGNLLYVGKAAKLLAEMSSAIRRTVHVPFPKGVKSAPKLRTEIVKYLSAYDVGVVKWNDFPKHVESLILRISKPLLNKNIGGLEKAYIQPKY